MVGRTSDVQRDSGTSRLALRMGTLSLPTPKRFDPHYEASGAVSRTTRCRPLDSSAGVDCRVRLFYALVVWDLLAGGPRWLRLPRVTSVARFGCPSVAVWLTLFSFSAATLAWDPDWCARAVDPSDRMRDGSLRQRSVAKKPLGPARSAMCSSDARSPSRFAVCSRVLSTCRLRRAALIVQRAGRCAGRRARWPAALDRATDGPLGASSAGVARTLLA